MKTPSDADASEASGGTRRSHHRDRRHLRTHGNQSRGATSREQDRTAFGKRFRACQFRAVERHSAGLWRAENIWEHLRQRLAFKIEIGACVAHCRLKAGVTQELADGPEINARLK